MSGAHFHAKLTYASVAATAKKDGITLLGEIIVPNFFVRKTLH